MFVVNMKKVTTYILKSFCVGNMNRKFFFGQEYQEGANRSQA